MTLEISTLGNKFLRFFQQFNNAFAGTARVDCFYSTEYRFKGCHTAIDQCNPQPPIELYYL